jgi:hypothetical protein
VDDALADLRHWLGMEARLIRSSLSPAQAAGCVYYGNQDLIVREGIGFTPHRTVAHPEPRACFHSSYAAATRAGSPYLYCEGYAFNQDLPLTIHHAWLVRKDDPLRAIETAWKQPGRAYLGLAFQARFVRLMRKRTRQYSVLEAWMIRYPLLYGKIPLEDAIERIAATIPSGDQGEATPSRT